MKKKEEKYVRREVSKTYEAAQANCLGILFQMRITHWLCSYDKMEGHSVRY
jgi:hypothetical protein